MRFRVWAILFIVLGQLSMAPLVYVLNGCEEAEPTPMYDCMEQTHNLEYCREYVKEVTDSKFHDPQSKDVYWYMISGEDKKKIEIEDTDDIAEVLHFLKTKGEDDK